MDKRKLALISAALATVAIGVSATAIYLYGYHAAAAVAGATSTAGAPAGDVLRIAEAYVRSFGDPNLQILEVEEYQYNYYVIVWNTAVDEGAFEFLIYPNGAMMVEPQSMMWNYAYGPHAGMMGGCRGAVLSEKEARGAAEAWISSRFPGATIEEAYAFPGYYTFHFKLPDGDMQMLSVNACGGAVWYHWWHGRFISTLYENSNLIKNIH